MGKEKEKEFQVNRPGGVLGTCSQKLSALRTRQHKMLNVNVLRP
jgi:hypothetical protein